MTAASHPYDNPSMTHRLFSAMQVVHWRNWVVVAALTVAAIAMLVPFLLMFSTSMRPPNEAYQLPPDFFPDRLSLDSYAEVIDSPIPFARMYLNSIIVAVVTTTGVVLTSAMAAFAFSRLRFRGSGLLFGALLLGLMVPPALVLVPLFFGMAALGLTNTLAALILPAVASPLGIFMMRQFMLSQPRELEEAAFVDGAGYWTIFWRISLPQMGPPIAALSIITFTQSWNNFIVPFVMTTKLQAQTLPVGILALDDTFGGLALSVLMAAVTMGVLPLLVIFLIGQRFIIEGITSAAIKG